MRLSSKYLMGSIPTTAGRTESEVLATSVSIRKEDRGALSTSDKLKLERAARSGGDSKFAFFQSTGQLVNSFETVYSLHMRLDSLTKALDQYDMNDVFKILPEETVTNLDTSLAYLLSCQSSEQEALRAVAADPTDNLLVSQAALASRELQVAEGKVDAVDIEPIDMMSRLHELNEATIRRSNRHYAT